MKKDFNTKYFLIYAAALLVLALAFLLLKKDNIIRWIESGITIRRQERQIEYYQKEIEDLRRRVEDMTSDKDTLEKYARETYGFSAPGEDVYIVNP